MLAVFCAMRRPRWCLSIEGLLVIRPQVCNELRRRAGGAVFDECRQRSNALDAFGAPRMCSGEVAVASQA